MKLGVKTRSIFDDIKDESDPHDAAVKLNTSLIQKAETKA
jgi:hypothetical protein